MLFSEPKIPQYCQKNERLVIAPRFQCSSASRKFLNAVQRTAGVGRNEFQCSSASRKFLNRTDDARRCYDSERFSALQRAENSSIGVAVAFSVDPVAVSVLFSEPKIPQSYATSTSTASPSRFSALQRAENSSIVRPPSAPCAEARVSVLFSEPKIPQ